MADDCRRLDEVISWATSEPVQSKLRQAAIHYAEQRKKKEAACKLSAKTTTATTTGGSGSSNGGGGDKRSDLASVQLSNSDVDKVHFLLGLADDLRIGLSPSAVENTLSQVSAATQPP